MAFRILTSDEWVFLLQNYVIFHFKIWPHILDKKFSTFSSVGTYINTKSRNYEINYNATLLEATHSLWHVEVIKHVHP